MRTGETGRPRRPSRAGIVAMLAWTLAVVAGGAIAWQALAAVDAGGRTGVLSQSEVTAALEAARATASAPPSAPAPTTAAPRPDSGITPTPAADPATATPPPAPMSPPAATRAPHSTSEPEPAGTTAPTASASTAKVVARTWTVPGGVIGVSCSGAAITLLYATPSDGWTVELGSTGPQHVEVQLQRDGAETTLTGTCVAGTPESRLESDDERSDDGSGRRRSVDATPSPKGDS